MCVPHARVHGAFTRALHIHMHSLCTCTWAHTCALHAHAYTRTPCAHVYRRTHTHSMHTCTQAHIHLHSTSIRTWAHIHILVYTGACTCALRAHMGVYTRALCAHLDAGAYTCALHGRTYTGAYMHALHAHTYTNAYTHASVHVFAHIFPRLCVGAHAAHVWSRAVTRLGVSAGFPPSAHGSCLLPVYLQGIDRSHSWVNSAYAPGGSRAVLRRAPPYCGADPRQVPTPLAPARL